jgi:hypothetical protein
MTDNKKILDEFDRKLDQELIDKHGTACNPVLVNGCFCKLQNTKERLKSFLLSALEAKDKERLNEIEELVEWAEKEGTPAVSGQITDSDECCNCGEDLALELYEAFSVGYKEALSDIIAKLQELKKRNKKSDRRT